MSWVPEHEYSDPGQGTVLPPGSVIGLFFSAAFLAGCLTLLFLAMRGVMELGGMVASGGPYAIEHPAPGWVWLFPVTIIAGLISAFAHAKFQHDAGGPPMALLAWPALFLSLGYNFLDFGLNPPGKGAGVAWAWLVCAIMFFGLALGPVVMAIFKALPALRAGSAKPVAPSGKGAFLILWNVAAAALGVWGGVFLFRVMSR